MQDYLACVQGVDDSVGRMLDFLDTAEAARPEVAARFAELKTEIATLQKQFADDGRFADPATLPKAGVEGNKAGKTPLGVRTAAEAIAASSQAKP
jgi:hypothetical protein